jgi:branched-chain amino acid transport system substrate-binding protein
MLSELFDRRQAADQDAFYWDMDDQTREWSKRFYAMLNKMPTMWQAGVYSSVISYLNAVKEAGTDDPLKVAAKMREKPINDMFARNGQLREDNLMIHDLILVQVKTPEESKAPWDWKLIIFCCGFSERLATQNVSDLTS